ncbi:4-hydroxybenzoate transporter [Serratia marcescens]|nr:4-hydroxybenzoate transporter [Serratia marcescens]
MADINRLCGLNVGIAVVDNQFCCFELKFCREMFCHWVTCGVGEVRISPSDQVASISVPLQGAQNKIVYLFPCGVYPGVQSLPERLLVESHPGPPVSNTNKKFQVQ